jgi:hypothetical protein
MGKKTETPEKEEKKEIRLILSDYILNEYLEIKQEIGTLSDTETLRVIIHTYFNQILHKGN